MKFLNLYIQILALVTCIFLKILISTIFSFIKLKKDVFIYQKYYIKMILIKKHLQY